MSSFKILSIEDMCNIKNAQKSIGPIILLSPESLSNLITIQIVMNSFYEEGQTDSIYKDLYELNEKFKTFNFQTFNTTNEEKTIVVVNQNSEDIVSKDGEFTDQENKERYQTLQNDLNYSEEVRKVFKKQYNKYRQRVFRAGSNENN